MKKQYVLFSEHKSQKAKLDKSFHESEGGNDIKPPSLWDFYVYQKEVMGENRS